MQTNHNGGQREVIAQELHGVEGMAGHTFSKQQSL